MSELTERLKREAAFLDRSASMSEAHLKDLLKDCKEALEKKDKRIAELGADKDELVRRLRNSNSKMRKAKDDLRPDTNCVAIARLSKSMEANAIAIAKHKQPAEQGS